MEKINSFTGIEFNYEKKCIIIYYNFALPNFEPMWYPIKTISNKEEFDLKIDHKNKIIDLEPIIEKNEELNISLSWFMIDMNW